MQGRTSTGRRQALTVPPETEATIETTATSQRILDDETGDVRTTEAADHVYDSAVAGGFYGRNVGGLGGKYDNVRRYWEDRITRETLRDALLPLLRDECRRGDGIRVLDLGSGSGEGYEIVTSVAVPPERLGRHETEEPVADRLSAYLGLDLSDAMVEEGRRIYRQEARVRFQVRDLAGGLGAVKDEEPPFDLYYSSYGSLSHLNDDELRRLVRDVAEHASGPFLFVADVLGRYSFEWQRYWEHGDGSHMRPYSMSYLYPRELRDGADVERFPIRYWGGPELDGFVREAFEEAGADVVDGTIRDRSVLVGRHMDTAEFNPRAQPIRGAVNRLHELDCRTDLDTLFFEPVPVPGCDRINRFHERFGAAWNRLVTGAKEALLRRDRAEGGEGAPAGDVGSSGSVPGPCVSEGDESPELAEALETVRNVVEHAKWFRMGDPRANVVEPQLGFVLKDLEAELQEGLGASHGLLGVFRVHPA